MKQSHSKLSVQLTESQQIITKVVAEKQELERKLLTSKEMKRIDLNWAVMVEFQPNFNNTRLFAAKQEFEEQKRIAKEVIQRFWKLIKS